MTLPNFIIVGAMRAGTTSLVQALQQHPDIYLAPREVHFFNIPALYEQGEAYYSSFFTDGNGCRAIGEKTPTYSIDPNVPARIAEMLPNVKLIWLFRNPVKRSYSHYWRMVIDGRERQPFEAALQREQIHPDPHPRHQYRERSVYVTQIENYLNHFTRQQMLFLLFEDLIQQPERVLRQALDFLEVDPDQAKRLQFEKTNAANIPFSPLAQYLVFQLFRHKGYRVFRTISIMNRQLGPEKYPPMRPETRAELQTYFEPYNRQLADLTGLDLSPWQQNDVK